VTKIQFGQSFHVAFFYTDELSVCLERAKSRFENGRHFVKPETISEMYSNTLPLLKKHFDQIDSIYFVNVTKARVRLLAFYDRIEGRLTGSDSKYIWFYEKLYPFINSRQSL
jgi:predicted ABC-type ATPase